MARKLRVEFLGAVYHVINRGNRRVGPFDDEKTRDAFETCLGEACVRAGWLVHAYVIMGNHFHIALETPLGNLAAGMQWMQATFTNRYNRFRGETGTGAIFQGRYKALPLEPGAALGQLCHYIHLNPVRAGLVPLAQLAEWRWSSYRWRHDPATRPAWLRLATALVDAGGLADTPAGWNSYAQYLAWQMAEGSAGRNAAYASMSQGWALGSAEFKRTLALEHTVAAETRAWEAEGAGEIRRTRWEAARTAGLRQLGKSDNDLAADRKSAPWKIALAAELKSRTDARNAWLAERLHMGSPTMVSQSLARARYGDPQVREWIGRLRAEPGAY
ncbi:MAG: transposase [Opitutae bacterium]|nr:transposase [Opitutae bacterium]